MISLILEAIAKNIIAFGSLIVAISAAFFAYRSSCIAKKALNINQMLLNNKLPDFDIYLIDSARISINKGMDIVKTVLAFNLAITNKSENKNAFSATLEVEYYHDDETTTKILLSHQSNLGVQISEKKLDIFPDDIRVDDRSKQSKWVVFDLPLYVLRNRIDKYNVCIVDVAGIIKRVEVILLKEL